MRAAVLATVVALAAPAAAQTQPWQTQPWQTQPWQTQPWQAPSWDPPQVVRPQTLPGQPGQPRGAPAPVPPTMPPPGPPPAEAWMASTGVELVALDKVTARTTQLSGRVGEDVRYGALTIVARSCVVRPPGVSPDAAAFLEITDSRPGVAPFRGWMLMSVPSVSIYEHPVYDIRVAGCRL